jgi:endo-1,4-beta-xylanase
MTQMFTSDKSVKPKDSRLAWILALLVIVLLLFCLLFALVVTRAGLTPLLLRNIFPGAETPQAATISLTPSPIPTPTTIPRTSLRSLAEAHGLLVGVSVAPDWLKDPEYTNLLTHDFNAVVPENAMKFEVIHPEPDRYDFSEGDAIVKFASENGLKVRGHTLVWGNQLPKWILEGDYTCDQWIEILREHITSVVGHYRRADSSAGSEANQEKTVIAWDVVNEAVGKQGELFNNFWLQKIGPEYIPLAFEFAHAADPDALLFYNDNAGEGLNQKSQGIYNLVQGMVNSGVPIDGVGLQMHTATGVAPSTEELAANMKRLGELGLVVHITEMDVRTQYSKKSMPEKLQDQAMVYRQVLAACLQSPNCKSFFTWGLTDRYSWIPGFTGKPDAPLLFDDNFQPKPALDAILDLLQNK